MASFELMGGKLQLFKRDNSRYWQCSASLGGRQRRVSTKKDNLAEAHLFAEDWCLEIRDKAGAGKLLEKAIASYAGEHGGKTPRLNTYPGWNVPNPLDIEICNDDGEARIETVLQDIIGLTKLNYNNCKFADGLPIAWKFASKVGDILTTVPLERGKDGADGDDEDETPLPFWHYI